MANEDTATSTDQATTTTDAPAATTDGSADQQTVTETKSTETTTPPAGGETGTGDNSQDTSTADTAAAAGSEAGDGSTAEKDQNRLGYQIRQIRGNDEYVAKLRSNLQDNYVNEAGLTDEQARIRKLESDAYIKDVEQARATLVTDNDRVAQEISLFNPRSKDFNKDLLDRSLRRFARDQLNRDENGEIIGFKIPLLDYMREEADGYLARGPIEAKSQETAAATMDAASETAGGSSPTQATSKKDPLDAAFEAGFDSVT